jgi:predicted molibdopterin-dependent oxidoreductase YjgC
MLLLIVAYVACMLIAQLRNIAVVIGAWDMGVLAGLIYGCKKLPAAYERVKTFMKGQNDSQPQP